MKFIIPIFLLAFLSISFIFSGCSQENEFATDPIESLHFSADTLSFDTVFSTVGTPTAWLKIYNTGNKNIRISGVSLKEGGKGFRLNLDGESKQTFTDLDILAKDSLFLFVELIPAEKGTDKPFKINDAIIFQTEGKQKQIVLEAYSQDVVIWHGKTITSDTFLSSNKPYLIYDSLVVAENAKLTIQEGATFYFHDAAKVVVHGSLKAIGTAMAPITFRGDRLDDVLPDLPYEYYPGQWGSVRFTASSYDNEFDYVHIRGANYGLIADASSTDRSKLKMTNSIIHNMTSNCILSYNSKMSVANSQITNSGSNSLCLIGGEYDFTHCTIANYQRLISRNGATLLVSNILPVTDGKSILYPLKSNFYNCIVFGNQTSEIDTLRSGGASWELLFKNCMLRSKEWSSNMATNCIYPSEAKFLKLGFDEDKYKIDFRLDSLSEARNHADPAYSISYPYDMNGVSRLTDGIPDIGAYEWIPGQK